MKKETFAKNLVALADKFSHSNPSLYASVQQTRDTITIHFIPRAEMRDQWVREMLNEMHRNYPKSFMKLASPERKIVVVEFKERNRVCGTGVALCSPTDKFDIGVGIAVAYAKWKGILVPDFV